MTPVTPEIPSLEDAFRLAGRVLDHIIEHPETHDNSMWFCKTTRCIAGWTLELAGYRMRNVEPHVSEYSYELLPPGESEWLPAESSNFMTIAGRLLGLKNERREYDLFLEFDDRLAVERLRAQVERLRLGWTNEVRVAAPEEATVP